LSAFTALRSATACTAVSTRRGTLLHPDGKYSVSVRSHTCGHDHTCVGSTWHRNCARLFPTPPHPTPPPHLPHPANKPTAANSETRHGTRMEGQHCSCFYSPHRNGTHETAVAPPLSLQVTAGVSLCTQTCR
jgi:hypothetical protein